ncbi:MAG: barnase inhibitor [Erythrobacter sp.]|nr:barnase inhibitor [Erythrobacter sp.]
MVEGRAMLVIDGADVASKDDFHSLLAGHPKVPAFYGRNLDALWDAITGLIERPFSIVWFNTEQSRVQMGHDFDRVVAVLLKAEQLDASAPWPDHEKFRVHLLTGPLQLPSEPSL